MTPSLPSCPEVANFMEHLNQDCEVAPKADTPPASPPAEATIGATLQLLDAPVPEELKMGSPRPLPILCIPPRSPFDEEMTEDLPLPDIPSEDSQNIEAAVSSTTEGISEEPIQEDITPATSVPQVSTETVSMSGTPPPPARPRHPTAAKKCPRKEFRNNEKLIVKAKEPHQKPKRLTVLQENCRLQTSFEDILPFTPFSRLVRELCSDLVYMRFTKEATQALRSRAESYLLEIFQKANLACCHARRCTLQPKDISLVRRVMDHDLSMGCMEEALQGWKMDFLKDRAKHITYKEAKSKEVIRRKKLRELACLRHKAYRCQANRQNQN